MGISCGCIHKTATKFDYSLLKYPFQKLIAMKIFICIALFAVAAGADKCEFGHTWLQGQQGSLEITVPANTIKWTVEMAFDKPPKHIHAHQGRDEGCDEEESVCIFGSENHNEELTAGDILVLPYQIQFDEDPEAPKVTSVVFKYCDAEPCDEESMQEYPVTDECTEAPEPTTEAPVEESEEESEEEVESEEEEESEEEDCGVIESHSWNTGATGKVRIPVPEDTEDWEVTLTFSGAIDSLDAHQGVDEACDGNVCTFTNESWNGALTAGNMLELTYQATFEETEEHPELLSVAYNGEEACAEE